MNRLADRGVPASHAIDLYRRTYTTVLRSSGEVRLRAFEAAHREMDSSLHPEAASERLDVGALIYAVNRLPTCIAHVRHVWLAQMEEQFLRGTGRSLEGWQHVDAPARRRHWHFDGTDTLAAYIASPSDLDDLVPTLVAYQIEWNKVHDLLSAQPALHEALLGREALSPALLRAVAEALDLAAEDWLRLQRAWGDMAGPTLRGMARAPKDMGLRLIGGTHVAYAKLIRRWSEPIIDLLRAKGLEHRPLYFLSSNTHGLVNLLSGYTLRRAADLEAFLRTTDDEEAAALREAWHWANRENLLYYAARLWARAHPDHDARVAERTAEEEARGIWHIPARTGFDVDAQVIELDRVRPGDIDPRLADVAAALVASEAVILNIDYPLGLAAYRILREIAEVAERLRGIYIVGKAATLNGDVGDVLISDVVFDEHSLNTYSFPNVFRYADLAPYLARGSVLDNQKAVTVRGTFLQNHDYLELFYREHYTVIEMEAGPYLSALYEATYPTRHPTGERIHFRELPCDLGIIHYASDTPYTRARTLGGRGLSFEGIDATYAAMVAVVRRIAALEGERGPAGRPERVPAAALKP